MNVKLRSSDCSVKNRYYGYTIEKIIEERGMRHWTDIGFSSIYYVLKRLESRNLIVSSAAAGK